MNKTIMDVNDVTLKNPKVILKMRNFQGAEGITKQSPRKHIKLLKIVMKKGTKDKADFE